MEHLYSAPQSYTGYEHAQWSEDMKRPFTADEHDRALHEKSLNSAHVTATTAEPISRTPSMLKTEDDFSASGQSWHDRSHEHQAQMRHFSHPQVPTMNAHVQHPDLTASFHHSHQWSVPHSGSSTPTPIYGTMDPYGQHVSYAPAPSAFPAYTQDPISAVSMSPQSSQGGWASNNSSDGTDQRGVLQSPSFRAASPTAVVRSDGIRKKNARFEIPKERNLANIDAMILASTDDGEKKELKQQKRLLRNRQAALDSRQRKKTHTEKLEQEKKVSEKKMYDLEEAFTRLETQFAIEREQWLQQRQQFEHAVQALSLDRDEAIRSKTQETGELRRQNSMLKDCVRDLERQQHRGYVPASDADSFDNDFNDFGLENNWDEEFRLVEGGDYSMDEHDHDPRQTTPKPHARPMLPTDSKADNGFSWNTFYMCLLFGAFIAANSNSTNTTNGATSAIASSISPSEAGNVLKAVLESGSEFSNGLAATPLQSSKPTLNGQRQSHTSALEFGPSHIPTSTLDNLHHTLSTPSRRQEMAAAFSLSASSYNHITDPFNEHLNHVDDTLLEPRKPSQLQQAFANMQAEKDEMERATGLGSKYRERSLLWDQVPPQVVKDFEELVRRSGGMPTTGNEDKMEQ